MIGTLSFLEPATATIIAANKAAAEALTAIQAAAGFAGIPALELTTLGTSTIGQYQVNAPSLGYVTFQFMTGDPTIPTLYFKIAEEALEDFLHEFDF